MNMRNIFFILLSIMALETSSQTRNVQFTYDNAGNRIGRAIVLAQAPKSRGFANDSVKTEIYTDIFADYQLRVYPNPTKGDLKIELCGLPDGEIYHLLITDASGVVIVNRRTSENPTVADLTEFPAGIYIMRLQYKNFTKDFKIIRL